MRLLIAIYFWPAFVLTTLCLYAYILLLAVRSKLTGNWDSRPFHRVATWWGRAAFAMTPGWRISVEGAEHLPGDHEAMVVVANHESMSDIWAMYFLGIQFRWLSKVEVFRYPVVGSAMRFANYVPVTRGEKSSHAEAMRASADRLKEGLCMFFFPEGTRSKDGTIKEFKSGAFRLARECQTPVLPVAIHGAGNLLPKGSIIPRPTHVKVRVLPPVPPPTATEDLGEYAARVRESIVNAHQSLLH